MSGDPITSRTALMTAALTDVTMSVEPFSEDIAALLGPRRPRDPYFVVRRVGGEVKQVLTSGDDRAKLAADARACAQTWSATYVERGL